MTALARPASIEIGSVINRTFGAIGANFGTFFGLSLLLAAIPTILITMGYTVLVLRPIVYSDADSLTSAWGVLAGTYGMLFLSMIPASVLTGALTQAAIVHYNGGKASFGECISTGLRFMLPLIGLGIITAFGLFLWAILLIIPAILAMTRWAVASPALVVDRTGVFDAFQRSIDLTSGQRWRIFLLGLIYVVISWLISAAITFLSNSFSGGFGSPEALYSIDIASTGMWIDYGVQTLYATLNAMILGAGQAALYYELRVLKEGATSDELAKVFD